MTIGKNYKGVLRLVDSTLTLAGDSCGETGGQGRQDLGRDRLSLSNCGVNVNLLNFISANTYAKSCEAFPSEDVIALRTKAPHDMRARRWKRDQTDLDCTRPFSREVTAPECHVEK